MLVRSNGLVFRRAVLLLVVTLAAWVSAAPIAAAQSSPSAVSTGRPAFVEDELLVKFRPAARAVERANSHRLAGGQVARAVAGADVQVVRVGRGQLVQRLAMYQRDPNVEFVERNGIAYPAWTPNDQLYESPTGQQWSLNNTGRAGATADRDIDAPQAWDVTQGTASSTIAIVDTGIMIDHPDLAPKVIDSRNWYDGGDVGDRHGHGTHVAGIAAAATNNGVGVAGVCPSCTLLNAKVCDDSGACPYDRLANGVLWSVGCEWRDAQDNCLSPMRASTINISIAGSEASATLRSAIERAWARGAVLACAAGNNGTTTRQYPAAYANCIAVAATDANDARASWSSYGSAWVDVAAPGVGIWSTLNPAALVFAAETGYGRLSGTSMASPHVAGEAALLWSQGTLSTNRAVRTRVEATAERITGSGAWWSQGRINACRAVGGSGC